MPPVQPTPMTRASTDFSVAISGLVFRQRPRRDARLYVLNRRFAVEGHRVLHLIRDALRLDDVRFIVLLDQPDVHRADTRMVFQPILSRLPPYIGSAKKPCTVSSSSIPKNTCAGGSLKPIVPFSSAERTASWWAPSSALKTFL